jgi:class 3 adenylate cyclase
MSNRFASVPISNGRTLHGPVHRSIVAVDLEGSTTRSNPVKGELRRVLYDVLDRALATAGIGPEHLEQLTDRGDGLLVLVKPHDDVPKTLLLGHLIPTLAALLIENNATVTHPALALRLRAVVHAGEVHDDGKGFFGEDLDIAFRLLDSPQTKRALREAISSSLILVISEEIFSGIVRHGYVEGSYEPLVRIRVAGRQHRGWVHIPIPGTSQPAARDPQKGRYFFSPPLTIVKQAG